MERMAANWKRNPTDVWRVYDLSVTTESEGSKGKIADVCFLFFIIISHVSKNI